MTKILRDPLDVYMNPKARLLADKQRWLDIIARLYEQWKVTKDKQYVEMMKFCGEQSQEIKLKLTQLK